MIYILLYMSNFFQLFSIFHILLFDLSLVSCLAILTIYLFMYLFLYCSILNISIFAEEA